MTFYIILLLKATTKTLGCKDYIKCMFTTLCIKPIKIKLGRPCYLESLVIFLYFVINVKNVIFKVMTVIASPGQGPDRSTEVSYTDTKEFIY